MAVLSTYSATQQYLEQPEPTQAAPETTPTTEVAQVETAADPASAPAVTTPETVQEENVSTFSLDGEVPEFKEESTTATQTPSYNWKDEIKKLDRKEVAKELGFNEFSLELDEYLAKGGKAADYLSAKAIDYNQISDEDLIKEDFRKQYPNFSKDEINRLFNRKYGVSDEMTDEERDDKLLELKADGYSRRQAKIEQQQKFKIPETPILHTDEAYEQWKAEQESRPKLIEEARNYFLQHEATKNLHESKRVTVSVGEGVPPFNFNVDKPEVITQTLTDDGSTWQRLTSTKTGEPDVQKRQLLALIANNPQKFVQDIFNYGKTMGVRKELVEEGQNAHKPQAAVHTITNGKPTYKVGTYGGR